MKRLLRWFQRRAGDSDAPAAAAPSSAPARSGPAAARPPATAPDLQFFTWLTGIDVADRAAADIGEEHLLRHLDTAAASAELRLALVPRAGAIIPQLLASLRDDAQSAQALTARVARDPNLVVEVLRLANAVGYGAGAPVGDLAQAVGRLGTEGLRRAIARILLKPIFDAQAESLLGRAADRLWQHSEAKAQLCLQTAAIARVEPFDGYLAGLMHNVGWTATLRALDGALVAVPRQFGAAFVRALAPRRDRLFAQLVQTWDLSAPLSALAAQVLAHGFAGAEAPLGMLLLSADRAAFLQLQRAGAGGVAPA